MKTFKKIFLFLIANIIGLLSVPICFHVAISIGLFSAADPKFNADLYKTYFSNVTYLTWMICALFSTAYFFLQGKEKYVFLWAPAVIPMVYGFSVLILLFSS